MTVLGHGKKTESESVYLNSEKATSVKRPSL